MFSFFRKKPAATPSPDASAGGSRCRPHPRGPAPAPPAPGTSLIGSALVQPIEIPVSAPVAPPAPAANLAPVADGAAPTPPAPTLSPTVPPPAPAVAAPAPSPAPSTAPPAAPAAAAAPAAPEPEPTPAAAATERKGWLDKLKAGLRKTGSSLATVFTGTQIDDAALRGARNRAADGRHRRQGHRIPAGRPQAPRARRARPPTRPPSRACWPTRITDLLAPLQKALVIGEHKPTVIMVAGVNGAGKTTSIGKLTKHLANAGASVLLAAADTFRAAAREQLAVWADRNTGGDHQPGGRRPGRGELRRGERRHARAARTWCWSTPPAACRRSCT